MTCLVREREGLFKAIVWKINHFILFYIVISILKINFLENIKNKQLKREHMFIDQNITKNIKTKQSMVIGIAALLMITLFFTIKTDDVVVYVLTYGSLLVLAVISYFLFAYEIKKHGNDKVKIAGGILQILSADNKVTAKKALDMTKWIIVVKNNGYVFPERARIYVGDNLATLNMIKQNISTWLTIDIKITFNNLEGYSEFSGKIVNKELFIEECVKKGFTKEVWESFPLNKDVVVALLK